MDLCRWKRKQQHADADRYHKRQHSACAYRNIAWRQQLQCLSGVPAAPTPASIAALYSDNCTAVAATLTGTTTTGSNATGWTDKYNYTVSDANGNTTIACVTYTGKDTQAPVPTVATLPAVTGNVSASVTAPTATDNCAGTITATTLNPTSYTAAGTYTITWTL